MAAGYRSSDLLLAMFCTILASADYSLRFNDPTNAKRLRLTTWMVLRGGAEETFIPEASAIQNILQPAALKTIEEHHRLADMFSDLDKAQRLFYDLTNLDSWSTWEQNYERCLAFVKGGLDSFIGTVEKCKAELKQVDGCKCTDLFENISYLQRTR